MKKIAVSIIIVNYHVQEEILTCITSIYQSKPSTSFEIIVVDNDEEKTFEEKLQARFPEVLYIPNDNKGFGQANNVGAKQAKGEYFFFLNPDTKVFSDTIDSLYTYIKNTPRTGIVAPLLEHEDGTLFPLQGAEILTPLRAVFALSLLSKLFPKNPIAKEYWNMEWNKRTVKKVGSVPGTALMIENQLFKQIGGFDDIFFLYFEENDLCKRVIKEGYDVVMYPKSRVFHAWEQSTKKSNKNIAKIFRESRFYYLKKHFGFLAACITEDVLRVSSNGILLTGIFLAGATLRLNHIQTQMTFIGDQGWYYLSARDMLLGKGIPLVGITASHTWLHQGALWTYFLSILFYLFNFNPLIPGLVTTAIDSVTILVIYVVAKELFSKHVALFASIMYAFSPFLILASRMPFVTSFIPLVVLLFLFTLVRYVIRSEKKYIYATAFLLGLLYNLELATVVFIGVFCSIVLFGIWQKKQYAKILTPSVAFVTFLCFSIPMIPIYLYDVGHGFHQTIIYGGWIVYHFFSFLFHQKGASMDPAFLPTSLWFVQKSILVQSGYASILFFLLVCTSALFLVKRHQPALSITVFTFGIALVGYIASHTASEAYIPMLLPLFYLLSAAVVAMLFGKARIIAILLLVSIGLCNTYAILQTNYFLKGSSEPFAYQVHIARDIVVLSNGEPYQLQFIGPGDKFASSTMQYAYLAWWLGSGPRSTPYEPTITITQKGYALTLTKKL